jgi:hypothetical protein
MICRLSSDFPLPRLSCYQIETILLPKYARDKLSFINTPLRHTLLAITEALGSRNTVDNLLKCRGNLLKMLARKTGSYIRPFKFSLTNILMCNPY